MKIILPDGTTTLVDDETYPWVSVLPLYLWRDSYKPGKCYVHADVNGKSVPLHRLIMAPRPGYVVDHINGDTLDNRRENLRVCLPTENARNRRRSRNNTSGYTGVVWHNQAKGWRAKLLYNGKVVSCGIYDSKEEAARARDRMALKLRGEFALLNFPEERDRYAAQG